MSDWRPTEEEYAEMLRRPKKRSDPPPPSAMSEMDLQGAVRNLALLFHWRTYHTYRSDRSDFGFPDLTMVRGQRVLFVELKSEKGKLSEPQEGWIADLTKVGRPVEVYVWRPVDLTSGTIAEILGRRFNGSAPAP